MEAHVTKTLQTLLIAEGYSARGSLAIKLFLLMRIHKRRPIVHSSNTPAKFPSVTYGYAYHVPETHLRDRTILE